MNLEELYVNLRCDLERLKVKLRTLLSDSPVYYVRNYKGDIVPEGHVWVVPRQIDPDNFEDPDS